MFFLAAKVGWALLAPLDLFVMLCLVSCVLRGRQPPAARLSLCLAAILFCLTGIFPLGSDLIARLETRYSRPESLPAHIDGILVLGGALDTKISALRGFPIMGQHAQRLLEGQRLARLYPNAKLVFTGGENSLVGGGEPEASVVQTFLERYALPAPSIVYESRSRNTAENFVFTKDLVHPKAGETWVLVTSAFHMPRAMASARAAGWPPMIAWPANYLTDDRWHWLPTDLNFTAHFYLADTALREYLGLFAYRFLKPEKHAK